jgi:hypothetical protein
VCADDDEIGTRVLGVPDDLERGCGGDANHGPRAEDRAIFVAHEEVELRARRVFEVALNRRIAGHEAFGADGMREDVVGDVQYVEGRAEIARELAPVPERDVGGFAEIGRDEMRLRVIRSPPRL